MIKIGGRGSEMFTRTDTIIDLKGRAIFHGVVELGHGCLLRVEKSAIVTFGQDVRLGALTKIFCVESISFGNEIDFSWECQIFDSNFHYIRDLNSGAIRPITSPVTIGSYNWFGNNVDIMKGARTPDHLICASNSLCNKDYGDLAHHCVIGGYPAELLASNRQRVFENLEDVGRLIVYSCLEFT